MAYLLDEIRNGIILSHDFSKHNEYQIYDTSSLHKIDIKKLKNVVLDKIKGYSEIKEIKIFKSSIFPNNGVYGMLLIKGGIAKIIVNKSLNECWERFTICKELMQLYIDQHEGTNKKYAGNIVMQLTELCNAQANLINGMPKFNLSGSFKEDISPEFQAISMATDLVFPYSKKDTWNTIFEAIPKNAITYYDIALAIKMPEFVVKSYDQTFKEISNQIKPQ